MTVPSGITGVIHVPALPGDPASQGAGFSDVLEFALRDLEALVSGGVDAIILENFGSAPFPKGDASARVEPHVVALLAILVERARGLCDLPIGVNCLRNDVISALGIAAASGANFVRVNIHTGAYVTDQGLIEGEAERSLRYRGRLAAHDVAILADVLVKHATPLAPVTATQATHDTLDRGMADAVIVTGSATGAGVDEALLTEVSDAAGGRPVLIGSGLSLENASTLAPLATGAIVGTAFKADGKVRAPVDAARVRALVDVARPLFRA